MWSYAIVLNCNNCQSLVDSRQLVMSCHFMSFALSVGLRVFEFVYLIDVYDSMSPIQFSAVFYGCAIRHSGLLIILIVSLSFQMMEMQALMMILTKWWTVR